MAPWRSGWREVWLEVRPANSQWITSDRSLDAMERKPRALTAVDENKLTARKSSLKCRNEERERE
jgi:hypothetical protein